MTNKGDLLADLAEQLGKAIAGIGLGHAETARIMGTSPDIVAGWLSQQATPEVEVRSRLLEFAGVLGKLSVVLRPEPARDWLFTPNDSLGRRKPADLLRAGEFRRVQSAIDALSEGVFVT